MAPREPSWWPDRTVAAKLEDPRVLTGSGNWFGELSRWSNLPSKILMTMSRVKDTTELFVSTFELNLAGTRLVPHSWRRPLQLHNCIIAEADALSSTAATASQDKALLTSVPPNPQSTPSNPVPASGVIQEPQSHDCNAGISPWVPIHFMRSVLADLCPLRGLMVDHSTIDIVFSQYWNQIEKRWLNHFDVQNVCCAGQLFIFLSSYLVVVR